MVHELNCLAGVAVDGAPIEMLPRTVRVRAAAVSVIVAAAALLVLREAKPFVVPVLASVLCAYALEPAVGRLRRWGVPRLSVQVVAIAMMTFLLIVTGDVCRQKLVAIAGPRQRDKTITMNVITSIDRQIERYLIVRVLICGIVAVATGVPIALMGVDNAAVLGMLAGVLNVVPYIGPASGIVVVTLATYLQFKAIAITAAAGGAALAVAVLEGNFVTPLLMSRAG